MATTTGYYTPMLGVVGALGQAELSLAHRFDELHQLLYTKGGIRPTNAAIEEVAKLVYLRLWATRAGAGAVVDGVPVADLFEGRVSADRVVDFAKSAFVAANLNAQLGAKDSSGATQPLWPIDEPFRLANPEVLFAAASLVDEIVTDEKREVSDPLGTAFDAFLSGRYDHSGGLGTFLTPSSIARAMADIAFGLRNPLESWDRRSPVIADPFCGTGRFLVAAFEAAETFAGFESLASLLDTGLLGADQSPTAIAKSAINLMLYGASTPHVFQVPDSVTAPTLDRLNGSLELVLTNPPFGGGKYADPEGLRRASSAIPSLSGKSSVDPALACTVRSIDLLAPDGVLGIVLPDGIVDGRQFDELIGRRSDLSVVANLSLPTATFALSGTVAKTSAVFIQKKQRERAGRTILARVEHVGFVRQAGKAALDPEGSQIPDVVESISKAIALEENPTPLVQVSESPLVASVASDALISLDPSRIDPKALASRGRLEEQGGVRLSTYLSARRKQTQKPADSGLPFVSVLHVDALGIVSWPDAEHYDPTTPGQIAFADEVLVSLLNPSKLRAAVISSERERIICSSEFGVFRSAINPYAVLGLLYHPDVQAQLKPLGRGTSSSRRRISPGDVLDLIVPRLSHSDLAALGDSVANAMAAVEGGRAALFTNYGISETSTD
ncbi:HsdM family class I SAM-dependent methyltransferase [Cellulosimicrobium funkei]